MSNPHDEETVRTVMAIRKHAFVPGGNGDASGCWYEEDGFRCGFYRQFHEGDDDQ